MIGIVKDWDGLILLCRSPAPLYQTVRQTPTSKAGLAHGAHGMIHLSFDFDHSMQFHSHLKARAA